MIEKKTRALFYNLSPVTNKWQFWLWTCEILASDWLSAHLSRIFVIFLLKEGFVKRVPEFDKNLNLIQNDY